MILWWALIVYVVGLIPWRRVLAFTIALVVLMAACGAAPSERSVGVGSTPAALSVRADPGHDAQQHASVVAALSSGSASSQPLESARTLRVVPSSPATVTRDPQDVRLAIAEASREFGVDGLWLARVAYCESRFDRLAVGRAQEIGVFQFKPTTWVPNAIRLGYTVEHMTDVVAQSRVAAEMFSRGQAWQWSCK